MDRLINLLALLASHIRKPSIEFIRLLTLTQSFGLILRPVNKQRYKRRLARCSGIILTLRRGTIIETHSQVLARIRKLNTKHSRPPLLLILLYERQRRYNKLLIILALIGLNNLRIQKDHQPITKPHHKNIAIPIKPHRSRIRDIAEYLTTYEFVLFGVPNEEVLVFAKAEKDVEARVQCEEDAFVGVVLGAL